jgi:hypothetical protein
VAQGKECRVEDLVGRRVLAPDGTIAGRIEEIRAVREGRSFAVTGFHIGPRALLERIGVRHFGSIVPRRIHGYHASWDQLDLTDPRQPRLRCGVDQLKKAR